MLSIIVPVYNTKMFLNRCLNSLLGQPYENIEVLLIDDGSTDESGLFCEEYAAKDERVKCFHLTNGGQGRARNYGLDRAKGEYISFIDSDDWVVNDMFTEIMNAIVVNQADMCICGMVRDHSFSRRNMPVPYSMEVYDNTSLMKMYLTTPFITSSVCNKIYRKSLWENVRFPVLRAREDSAMVYKIIHSTNKAVHIGKCYYVQNVRPGSTERSSFSDSKMVSIQIERDKKEFIEKYYPEFKEDVQFIQELAKVKLMSEIVSTFSKKKYKSEYKNMLREIDNGLSDFQSKMELPRDFTKLQKIVHNQNNFILKCYLHGIEEKIIDMIQLLYERIHKQA